MIGQEEPSSTEMKERIGWFARSISINTGDHP